VCVRDYFATKISYYFLAYFLRGKRSFINSTPALVQSRLRGSQAHAGAWPNQAPECLQHLANLAIEFSILMRSNDKTQKIKSCRSTFILKSSSSDIV
jgi:hypothetical protein